MVLALDDLDHVRFVQEPVEVRLPVLMPGPGLYSAHQKIAVAAVLEILGPPGQVFAFGAFADSGFQSSVSSLGRLEGFSELVTQDSVVFLHDGFEIWAGVPLGDYRGLFNIFSILLFSR